MAKKKAKKKAKGGVRLGKVTTTRAAKVAQRKGTKIGKLAGIVGLPKKRSRKH